MLSARKYLLLISMLLPGYINAQGFSCGFDDWLDDKHRSPDWREQQRSLDSLTKAYFFSRMGADTQVYTLPVAFHILHENGPENIPDSLIIQGLDWLNQSFSNQGWFDQGEGGDIGIQFCLTQRGKYNEPSSGIEHVLSAFTNLTDPADDYLLKAPYVWNSSEILNIYVVKAISFASGYSTFPGMEGSTVDGIVLEARFFQGGPEGISVLSHEIGHYLGLYHTFQAGCRNYDCLLEGDRVCDTPPDEAKHEGCQSNNSCNSDSDDPSSYNPFNQDVDDLNFNYMDYNDPLCYHAFTDGQRRRMRSMLRLFRPKWLHSPMCLPQADRDLAIYEAKGLPFMFCGDSLSPQIRVINHGRDRISGFEVTVEMNGQILTQFFSPQTIQANGSLRWVEVPSIPSPGPGLHRFRCWTSQPSGLAESYPANDTFSYDFIVPYTSQLPRKENFDQGLPSDWIEYQPFGDSWQSLPVGGCEQQSSNQAIYLENKLFARAQANFLISPLFDLSGHKGVEISFEHSLAKQEEFQILQEVSFGIYRFCDELLELRSRSQISLAERSILDLSFIWKPETCEDWGKTRFNLDDFAGEKIAFVIQNEIGYNDYHRLYLDNWQISSQTAEQKSVIGLQEGDIRLFPNPSRSDLSIEIDAFQEGNIQLSIYNAIGQRTFLHRFPSPGSRSQIQIPTANWATGLYFVEVSQNEARVVKKFLKKP